MLPDMNNDGQTGYFPNSNTSDLSLYYDLQETDYNKYLFFAIWSALFGLPSNILLLVILMRIGLFSQNRTRSSYITRPTTGSFERFLFEVVIIDTLLIIYHFVDNFLSYIEGDRSAGQHYLIHVSDFCCKFFTYIAKMSVLLTTWLLLLLIINQVILSLEYTTNRRSCWNRGLYYINAKYSTVLLVFIFSVTNIYPIEVLKYQKKDDLQDYQKEGVPGVCSTVLEGKSGRLLNASNYGYNLLGIAIPCVLILVLSMIIICRTCRNSKHLSRESCSFHYIAGSIGILHSLFNLPSRCSDILLMSLSPYVSFFPHLIYFNHEAKSVIFLSYGYKFFTCILISRRFRLHAKSILCFLIENKYEDRHTTEIVSTTNDWQQLKRHHRHHRRKESILVKFSTHKLLPRKFSPSHINQEDLHRFKTSDTTSWIRPYFAQYEKRALLRPCGRAVSCHQIPCTVPPLSIDVIKPSDQCTRTEINSSPSSSSAAAACIMNVPLPSGEYLPIPLPQKLVP
ncbi:unnamed protein product [Adineta ricciae]|uniref:G-protein coupled receptors family 1 profile domain-containing protein n=1 Tax=Adineta ricciae TaxID=249248 RepID=A0A815LG05_ADIRI|nr:unnamed protein product [Adineta ricciae]